MLQAGLAAPISRGELKLHGSVLTAQTTSSLTGLQWLPSNDHRTGGEGGGLLLLQNKSQWSPERSDLKLAKPRYTQNINSSRVFFISFYKKNLASSTCCLQSAPLQNTQLASSQTLWYPACIRHLTGSKVRTATASTFTLKRASLQLWSAASGLRLCRGKCEDRNRVWHLFKRKERQSVKVQKLPSRNDFSQKPQGGKKAELCL